MVVLTDKQIVANLAANVKRLRGDRSQKWLADAVETALMNISNLENAKHVPNVGLVVRIADVLGTSVDALISEDAVTYSRKKLIARA